MKDFRSAIILSESLMVVSQHSAVPTEEMQLRFREKLGVRRAVLCALANVVIGPWLGQLSRAPL